MTAMPCCETNPMTRADRKRQLIAQGAIYRVELLLSRQVIQHSLQPQSLARRVLQNIPKVAFAAFRNRTLGASGINLQTMLPLLMSGVSVLAKSGIRTKPLLRRAAIAAAVFGMIALISRKKKPHSAQ